MLQIDGVEHYCEKMDQESSTSEFSLIQDLSPHEGIEENSILKSFVIPDQLSTPGCQLFNQVHFFGPCKLPNGSFSVKYKVNLDFKPKPSDRVALYKVGFTSSHEYLLYKWAVVPQQSETCIPVTVVFESSVLPEITDDHYQFCYLAHDSQIVGVSHPFSIPSEEDTEDLILSTRKSTNTINELQETNQSVTMRNKMLQAMFEKANSSNEELEMANKILRTELDNLMKKFKELKHEKEIEEAEKGELTNDLIEMENKLKAEQKVTSELEDKLTAHVVDMSSLKSELASSQEVKSITEERQAVLVKENENLKKCANALKEALKSMETSLCDCESSYKASQKVAMDLSETLQSQTAQSQAYATSNERLIQKVKKQKKKMASLQQSNTFTSTSSVGSASWDYGTDSEAESEKASLPNQPLADSIMQKSNVMNRSACSNCSVGTQNLSDMIENKMDNMVQSLTAQMHLLKGEITKIQPVSGASSVAEESLSAAVPTTSNEPKSSLYSCSFLPTDKTAPVFLPRTATAYVQPIIPLPISIVQSAVTVPTAPSPTPSIVQENTDSLASDRYQLPPPLRPETTVTASRAAVMRLLSQSPRPTSSTNNGPDQEDDEYLSLDEADANTQSRSAEDLVNYHRLMCPMCDLKFQTNSLSLLEEHVNSHLEHVCPMCSQAFERKNQKAFEQHVQEHLADEDSQTGHDGWISSSPFSLVEFD